MGGTSASLEACHLNQISSALHHQRLVKLLKQNAESNVNKAEKLTFTVPSNVGILVTNRNFEYPECYIVKENFYMSSQNILLFLNL